MNADNLRDLLAGPKPVKIHLIGVAGSGMSGIAALLLGLGHEVGGSDKVDTIEVERLAKKGLKFSCPHTAECVCGADLVVYSSAIKEGNPAYDEARRLGIPMVRRAEALAAAMASKKGIIVCGMHGKTTTSAMAAHLLRAGGLKPSHYVGAEIPILGTNARWDSEGDYFVAEGDESDGTLVNYHPRHAIVLNIEPEHLDFYKDLEAIDTVYGRLISQTSGNIFFCVDDTGAKRVCSAHPRAISYGHSPEAHYRLVDLATKNFCSYFRVQRGTEVLGEVILNIPGAHNALNALAAIAVATEIGVPFEKISTALETFRGARRRFEILYGSPRQLVVDDYGHHPTEIAATIATARTGPNKLRPFLSKSGSCFCRGHLPRQRDAHSRSHRANRCRFRFGLRTSLGAFHSENFENSRGRWSCSRGGGFSFEPRCRKHPRGGQSVGCRS